MKEIENLKSQNKKKRKIFLNISKFLKSFLELTPRQRFYICKTIENVKKHNL